MKPFVASLMSLWLAACTTMRPAYLPEPGHGIDGVAEGDRVVVLTRSGERQRFTVARIDEDALYSESARFAYVDLSTVEVVEATRFDRNTIWLIVSALAIGLALSADSGQSIYAPFCVYSSSDPDPSC